jgi:hypothetical protein
MVINKLPIVLSPSNCLRTCFTFSRFIFFTDMCDNAKALEMFFCTLGITLTAGFKDDFSLITTGFRSIVLIMQYNGEHRCHVRDSSG